MFPFLANVLAELLLLIPLLYLTEQIRNWVRRDYQAFLDLGPGGTPQTPRGWFRLKLLGPCRINVFEPPRISPTLAPATGFLSTLPLRAGPRPTSSGIAPQRQINQRADNDTFETISDMLKDLARRYPDRLDVKTSFLERHTIALFANPNDPNVDPHNAVFGNEIAHPHKIDGSMHLIMHPDDVRVVLQNQRGERHPLARANPPQNLLDLLWLTYFRIFETRPPVPEGLVLIYAPRDEEEMEVVRTMIDAAAWWCSGGMVDEEEHTREGKEEEREYCEHCQDGGPCTCACCSCWVKAEEEAERKQAEREQAEQDEEEHPRECCFCCSCWSE